VERGQDGDDVARPDADLRLVVTLADWSRQLLTEPGLEARLQRSVHA